jgi:ABC-2 type transport system ATP-binding protein
VSASEHLRGGEHVARHAPGPEENGAPRTPARGRSEPAPAVLVDDLVVRFGELEAVGGVSFAVAPGEVFGLLGPNGAGKTTTIRVLTTLLESTAGRALVAGFDVRNDSLAVRASIGYIPQAISVDGALTAYENLDFYGRVSGVPRRERRERIAEAIETMELTPMLDRLARTLSGGMLRRLEIATALLNRPVVLFLDEPTVGLDPTARRMVWERLNALVAQAGTTILVTTHLMEEAERYCDRLGVIDRGRLVEQGEPAELLERHGTDSLEEVFTAVTGRPIREDSGDEDPDEDEEGRLSDVRAQRRTARRLG